MVKLLVRYGADPTRPDAYGTRPYHLALAGENKEIAELLRGLEPNVLHDARAKRSLAERYHAPTDLIAFLEYDDRRLASDDGRPVADLLAIDDLYEFCWMGCSYLMLSRLVQDDFNCGEIVWCKERRAVCIVDHIEHDELFEMGPWGEFASDPATAIEGIWQH